jgi:hypothetical protein
MRRPSDSEANVRSAFVGCDLLAWWKVTSEPLVALVAVSASDVAKPSLGLSVPLRTVS